MIDTLADRPELAIALWAIVVVLVAIAGAVLVRRAAPGGERTAALLGGALAGLLLGHTVLGNAAPAIDRTIYLGGAAEAAALDDHDAETERRAGALRVAGVSPVAIEEMHITRAEERAPLEEALTRAERAHTDAVRGVVLGAGALLLGCGAATILPRRLSGWRAHQRAFGALGLGVFGVGVCSLLIALVPALVIAMAGLNLRGGAALSAALVFAIPGVAGSVPPATRLTCVVACAVGWALVLGAVMSSSAMGVGVGVAACAGLMLSIGATSAALHRRLQRAAGWLARHVLAPGATGLLVSMIDLTTAFTGGTLAWLAVLALIWSSDGRWVAWWGAWMLFRTHRPRPALDAARPLDAGGGIAQLLACVLLFGAATIEADVALAAVVGGIAIEATRGARRLVFYDRLDPG
ncbi:MAG: hypothetical protein AAGI30_03180 [Planctomycetota bacterium]